MYGWIWRRLPFGMPGKIVGSALLIAAAAAVLSPPDPFSMLAMMAPTVGLYYVAIWAVQRIDAARATAHG